jgi:hypothetical protein
MTLLTQTCLVHDYLNALATRALLFQFSRISALSACVVTLEVMVLPGLFSSALNAEMFRQSQWAPSFSSAISTDRCHRAPLELAVELWLSENVILLKHNRKMKERDRPMKEYMLLIRNEIDHQAAWPPEQHQQFLDKCRVYIGELTKSGNLKSAQPLVREGKIVSRSDGTWKDVPFNESKEVIVGYYHILAKDMDEAVSLAKRNPEFEYGTTARIEVRPVKMKEESIGFVYPKTL